MQISHGAVRERHLRLGEGIVKFDKEKFCVEKTGVVRPKDGRAKKV